MQSPEKYRVVGKYQSGERVVLTKYTTREIAEKIVSLMKSDSAFAELLIEADGGDDAKA